jgi:2'-hydroxyisoflavone reductase
MTRRDWLKLGLLASAAGGVLRHPLARAAGSDAPARPLRILILGGTGFTGPHQVRYALARGHKVTLFNRGRRPQDWPAEVEELSGDRNTGDLKALAGREWDVCIDNPTTLPFWVRDAGRALRGRIGHYIFISTISVYAEGAPVGADENAPLLAYTGKDAYKETLETLKADVGRLYGPLKAQSEKEAARQFPGKTTIIRPGLIVGPGDQSDRFSYWPVRIARGGDVLAPGDGDDPVQVIDARDLAEWTIRVAEQRILGTFNATGPDYGLTMAAMLHGIRASGTAAARFVWAPLEFLEAHKVAPWSDMPVWTPRQSDPAFATRSIARALAAGLTFRPLATTAADTLAWFRTLPAERQRKLEAGLTGAREAELLALFKMAKSGA